MEVTNENDEGGIAAAAERTLRRLRMLLNLRGDTDEAGTVDTIRRNVDFKSANAWTLVFAIFIACVGLDTNNPVVIIGAMLISPLMGPVVGMGLGLGTNDSLLLKRALRNLGFAVGIAIATSTVYFLLSPLGLARSEILALTRPTFFDVIVAFFGGAAGIVAQSRKTRGNAIAGVAIATALMPPLCTTGFGIATGQLTYVLGALYLFLINSVFICIATFLFVRYLRFAKVRIENPERQRRTERWVAGIAVLVVIPSLLLAWQLRQESLFANRATSFIEKEIKFPRSFVVDHEFKYSWTKPVLSVGLLGDTLSPAQIETLKAKMLAYDLPPEALELRQTSLDQDMDRRLNEKLSSRDAAQKLAEGQIAQLEAKLRALELDRELGGKIAREVQGLFPQVEDVLVLAGAAEAGKRFWIRWAEAPAADERRRFDEFLRARAEAPDAPIEHTLRMAAPTPTPAPKKAPAPRKRR